jgi:hypothetical protein
MRLTSASDMTLVGVASPAAKIAEIPRNGPGRQHDDNTRRRGIGYQPAAIDLKPGGYPSC